MMEMAGAIQTTLRVFPGSKVEGFIYWKRERREDPWKLIRDTQEEKQKAIKSGAHFFTWASLSAPYTNNESPEPHRWGDLPLDFDSAQIDTALGELKQLCLIHLPQFYNIDPHRIRFFLSGGKGFHAIIPARLLNAEGGSPYLPLIYKNIALRWKKSLNLVTLDLCLYNMKKGRMFRIENIRRENSRYKVPLKLDEVTQLKAEELMELGAKPRHLEE